MMSASLPLSAAGAGGLPLPCGADYSQLYCRGQLALDTGSGEYIVSFSKNAIGAGTMGRTLAAGSCAFSDRPLTSDEPSQIVGGQFIQTRSGDILDPAYSAIRQCLASQSCVFDVCVENDDAGDLLAEPYLSEILFPRF